MLGSLPVEAVPAPPALLFLLTAPLETEFLTLEETSPLVTTGAVATAATISQAQLTVPSLWWAEEQFGRDRQGNRLLETWLAFAGRDGTPRRVDLVVNRPLWNRTSYADRYAFLSRFGTVSGDFGYSTRVFSLRGELLGVYTCTFLPPEAGAVSQADQLSGWGRRSCQVFLDETAAGTFRGITPFDASPANGERTAP